MTTFQSIIGQLTKFLSPICGLFFYFSSHGVVPFYSSVCALLENNEYPVDLIFDVRKALYNRLQCSTAETKTTWN